MSIMPGGFFDREDGKSFVDPKQKELLEKVMDSFPRLNPSEEASDTERLQAFVRTTTRQVKSYGSIAASTSLEMIEYIRQMERVLIETSEYLSSNPKNYVGSGSILHTKMRKVLELED